MPNRPTKEFWQSVYPKLRKEGYSKERAAKIAAGLWYHKLSEATKERFERSRRRRERKS